MFSSSQTTGIFSSDFVTSTGGLAGELSSNKPDATVFI
jgi:hypothetical protein